MTTPQPAALPELLTDTDVARIFRRVYGGSRFDATERNFAAEIEATVRERFAALQSQPAAAGVSDDDIASIAQQHWPDATNFGFATHIGFARAILALRPQAVPMTEGTARQFVEWMKAQPEDREPTTIDGALAEFEARQGITAQGAQGGEG